MLPIIRKIWEFVEKPRRGALEVTVFESPCMFHNGGRFITSLLPRHAPLLQSLLECSANSWYTRDTFFYGSNASKNLILPARRATPANPKNGRSTPRQAVVMATDASVHISGRWICLRFLVVTCRIAAIMI